MAILISELYGKHIITNAGQKIGMVEDVIIDFEKGSIKALLLTKMEDLTRTQERGTLNKNMVNYDRVSSVAESIIVKATPR